MKITISGFGVETYSYHSPISPEIEEKISYKGKTYRVKSITHMVGEICPSFSTSKPPTQEIETTVEVEEC